FWTQGQPVEFGKSIPDGLGVFPAAQVHFRCIKAPFDCFPHEFFSRQRILKRKHLFREDVGVRGDRTCEKLCFLKNRRPNVTKSVGPERFTRRLLEPIPELGIGWKYVAGAFDSAELIELGHKGSGW